MVNPEVVRIKSQEEVLCKLHLLHMDTYCTWNILKELCAVVRVGMYLFSFHETSTVHYLSACQLPIIQILLFLEDTIAYFFPC